MNSLLNVDDYERTPREWLEAPIYVYSVGGAYPSGR